MRHQHYLSGTRVHANIFVIGINVLLRVIALTDKWSLNRHILHITKKSVNNTHSTDVFRQTPDISWPIVLDEYCLQSTFHVPSRQAKILEKEFVIWLIFDKATVITCTTYHLTIINDPSIDEITTPHKKTHDMHTHKSIDVTELQIKRLDHKNWFLSCLQRPYKKSTVFWLRIHDIDRFFWCFWKLFSFHEQEINVGRSVLHY